MVPLKSLGTVSYSHSIVTMALSCTEIKREMVENRDFSYPSAFDAPVRILP